MAMGEIPLTESLTVEFKSDRDALPDRDLLAGVVAMANTDGGDIYVGVEDDGRVTGLHPRHRDETRLGAMIANRTVPPVPVRVEKVVCPDGEVVRIAVPRMRQLVATTEGLLLRRRLLADGTPESVPFLPHEFGQRQASLSALDVSAQAPSEATVEDLNPVARERLRGIIRRQPGEASLLELADTELDGALGITLTTPEGRKPTLAGLLMIGHEESLRRLVPVHEAAFQVLDGTNVKVNEFSRAPLVRLLEEFEQRFAARNDEEEVEDGLFRVSVPTFDRRAFREGLVNALVHRDYTRLGAVHVRFEENALVISNPGGFVEGVTLRNILTVEPKPRNPLLADMVKRIGLAERTGRGVDRIYEGMLRFGRPEPDYARSDATSVVLRLAHARPDVAFMRMIADQENRGGTRLPVDSLLVLSRLRERRRCTAHDLAEGVLVHGLSVQGTLERLVEAGLIAAHGTGQGRTYTLSAQVYRSEGNVSSYIRQAGFSPSQQEQMVLQYVRANLRITRAQCTELCRLSPDQASRLLRRMSKPGGPLVMHGTRRSSYYEIRA